MGSICNILFAEGRRIVMWGMGAVILILIMLLIIIILLIDNRRKAQAATAASLTPATPVPVVSAGEDENLIAAICAAAVASMLGTDNNGFVIRSIKRKSAWRSR